MICKAHSCLMNSLDMSVVKRVRKSLPGTVARELWVSSGGRCEYEGCNTYLLRDSLTQRGLNKSYISHIIAASPNGPRGSEELSEKLEIDGSNLMLLCDECHNRIDEAAVEEHTVECLRKMKREHEQRIELVTSLVPEKRSHVLFYGANIGVHESPLHFAHAVQAMLPQNFPSTNRAIELSLKQRTYQDSEEVYWSIECESLSRQFASQVSELRSSDPISHYSIFALAPQPLLIKLGVLLGESFPARVYQLHRDPASWTWKEDSEVESCKLVEPEHQSQTVALKLELSATIQDDRIIEVLGDDTSIWSIRIATPYNNFLKSEKQLDQFKEVMRKTFDRIKAIHGENTTLNVFPAMPVATAVEMGRVWMPKADLPMVIFDQNNKKNGFHKAIEINATN